MRYLKVLFLVLVFFVVMLFFVQNQASFADPVVLKLDLMFVAPMESMPVPLYALMLACFTVGGLLVLLMLMWDRVSLSARCTSAKSKVTGLAKKLEKVELSFQQHLEKAKQEEEKLKEKLKVTEEKLAKALEPHKNDTNQV